MKDSTWVMYQKRILDAISDNNWRILSVVYYEMAERVGLTGTDGNYLRKQGFKARQQLNARELDNHLLEMVQIVAGDRACNTCKASSGKILSAEDARLLHPIPQAKCTQPTGCLCWYIPVTF